MIVQEPSRDLYNSLMCRRTVAVVGDNSRMESGCCCLFRIVPVWMRESNWRQQNWNFVMQMSIEDAANDGEGIEMATDG